MDGRVHSAAPRPVHLRRLGSVMARLHNHAGQWRVPPGGLACLDDFIATREVAFGLWFTGTAQVNPVFRAELDQVQGEIGRSLDILLRN